MLKLLIVAALAWALVSYLLGVFVIHSNDMYPAIRDGDLLITYRPAMINRGDIIAYSQEGIRRVGRVVGVEGDLINMDPEGGFTVNGTSPYETIYYVTRSDPDSALRYPYTVPAGTVFVLNDLRDNMGDSRSFGAVPLADSDGAATLLLRRRSW